MANIIHIATDNKFINSANYQFEKIFPKRNIFKIITNKEHEKLIHVKTSNNIEIVLFGLKQSASVLFYSELII